MEKAAMVQYQYQLLRYVPNLVSGEYVNVGVFLYDGAGRMIDARFARDFRRLRCHPLADLEYLTALRNEFEEQRLLGEGFSDYGQALQRDLSLALQVSDQRVFWGAEAGAEIERLYRAYVATPSGPRNGAPDIPSGARRALRRRMDETFGRYYLFANGGRLRRDVSVNYGGGRLRFAFDYGYQPNGVTKYLHGVALRNDVRDATQLCFVLERLRGQEDAGAVSLTAVVDDEVPGDTLDLLGNTGIAAWKASKLDELALAVRKDLGL